jgi:hypothetical protein
MRSTQHCNDNKKRVVTLQESIALEKMNCGGPDEIRNPDDASGARIEVHRAAQHRNMNDKTSVNQLKTISKDVEKCGGPDEIRTHDPRRVKKAIDDDSYGTRIFLFTVLMHNL